MRSVRSHVRAYIARITPIILKILLSNKSYLLFYSSTKLMWANMMDETVETKRICTHNCKPRHKASTIQHSLTFRVRCCVVIATKPMRRLQICLCAQLEGTPTIPPSYIGVRAVVWEYGEGRTDRQTDRHKLQWQTHRRAWPIYNSRHLRLTRNVARHRASRPYTSTCLHFTLGAIRISIRISIIHNTHKP